MSAPQGVERRRWALSAGAAIAACLVLMGLVVHRYSPTAHGASSSLAAPDFVVSSTRDAGPGTLRDAILAADRLSTRARILITAQHILTESALPAFVNPRGVDVEVATGAGTITTSALSPVARSRTIVAGWPTVKLKWSPVVLAKSAATVFAATDGAPVQ